MSSQRTPEWGWFNAGSASSSRGDQPGRSLRCTAVCRIDTVMVNATTSRLEARLPADVHALLKRAAEIEGRTLTDFVVAAASAAARRTIEEADVLKLSTEDQQRFADALINPPALAPAMQRAIGHHRRLVRKPARP